jgi:hypothetical protein
MRRSCENIGFRFFRPRVFSHLQTEKRRFLNIFTASPHRPYDRSGGDFQSSRACPAADGHPETMKMREAPWSAAARLPP